MFNSENKIINGSDKNGNFSVEYSDEETYTRTYDSGKTRVYKNGTHISGADKNGRQYDVKTDHGNKKTITYRDNGEVYITQNDKIIEHQTKEYNAKYSYNRDDSFSVTSTDKRGFPRKVQYFDSKGRITRLIDYQNKENDFRCTYDSDGNATYKYRNGSTMVYDAAGNVKASNGFTVDVGDAENNGKLDGAFAQGDTGDCWLVSGLASIMTKPNGKEFLEKQIKYDQNTSNYTVTLPGAGRKYTITKAEIDSSDFLAAGDKDVRLFEIAMDKYLKEISSGSAKDEHSTVLDGNTTEAFYDAMFGKNSGQTYNVENYDVSKFNNSKKLFTVANTREGVFGTGAKGISPDGNSYPLEDGHGYSVLRADNQYVYLLNPVATFDPNNPEQNAIKVDIKTFKFWCNTVMEATATV